ncbi:hypothetical protein [Morganella morganii]|uniref:hypothetical protein n=1 Tax=Morganella morganii TaxID=582 RepID=UPI001E4A39EB|nr:hypothetical protein [Morganella morganii]
MKIAFMGISGSGKDFLANYLISNYEFFRLSFSDQLKKLATYIYPWMEKDYSPEKKNVTTQYNFTYRRLYKPFTKGYMAELR